MLPTGPPPCQRGSPLDPAPRPPGQKLTHDEMLEKLGRAQEWQVGLVVCAGCGRVLEPEFLQLDHRMPRTADGENYITNRVLIRQPCNMRKSDALTPSGLWRENKKVGWMKDEAQARWADQRAPDCGDQELGIWDDAARAGGCIMDTWWTICALSSQGPFFP